MLNVGSLARAELAAQLAGTGIRLRTGAFTTCLHSAIPSLAEGIALLYADYPLLTADDFADFHLQLVRPLNARRWIKPQVKLLYDRRSIFKPLPLDQAFPMFEWGLNWCVSSRANRYLIVHAAVVEKGGRALILPAPPGSGKSTLCAALVGRGGWRLLSDELTLLRLDDGLLHPLPRPVSLKNASIEIIARYVPQAVTEPPRHRYREGHGGAYARARGQHRAQRRDGAAGLGGVPALRGRRRHRAGTAGAGPRLHAAGAELLQLQPAGRARLHGAGRPGRAQPELQFPLQRAG
ncbi:HprK-related kinase A [Massilia sp. MB5]|uniref:HprK-related kinase A n=1 Tax=Massilia sp. MB5 TaxID=2919578 RepID=UPI001F0DBC76|nr:HprK-related kinase A [Massilia sp. MB5]UMR32056.1 HprK-related kinase A [Massilia sp. MB5]